MVVKSTRVIREGKQWLLNYGPWHQCGERAPRKRLGVTLGVGGVGGKEKSPKTTTAWTARCR